MQKVRDKINKTTDLKYMSVNFTHFYSLQQGRNKRLVLEVENRPNNTVFMTNLCVECTSHKSGTSDLDSCVWTSKGKTPITKESVISPSSLKSRNPKLRIRFGSFSKLSWYLMRIDCTVGTLIRRKPMWFETLLVFSETTKVLIKR